MNSNNNGCHQVDCSCQRCCNRKFNCTGVRPFRAIDAACIPPSIPEPPKAYGSFYDPSLTSVDVIPVTPPSLGEKVIFTTPGPSLGVDPAPAPNNNTDLQVATSGVYEISMDISVDLRNTSGVNSFNTVVQFGLFINDTIVATESIFESVNGISVVPNDIVEVRSLAINTIGRTVQLRLNKDDRLSIRVIFATQRVEYSLPSLVVTKIDN